MERWEHIAVVYRYAGPTGGLTQIEGDGVVQELTGAGVGSMVAAVNRLGREGWMLVSTDEAGDGGYYGRTAWMRRPIA